MKQIKTAEEILKENYLHPLSKTEKYWIVKSMQTYAQQLKPEWTAVEELKEAFEAGGNNRMKPFTTDLCGVDCPDFEEWYEKKYGTLPNLKQ